MSGPRHHSSASGLRLTMLILTFVLKYFWLFFGVIGAGKAVNKSAASAAVKFQAVIKSAASAASQIQGIQVQGSARTTGTVGRRGRPVPDRIGRRGRVAPLDLGSLDLEGCASSRLDHGLKFYGISGGCASSRLISGSPNPKNSKK